MASWTVPTPAADWLSGYPRDAGPGDLYRDAGRGAAGKWAAVAHGLGAIAEGDPAVLAEVAERHSADLGLAFRLAGDQEERAWPITPMPLVVSGEEWAQVERGLIQRANLLEALATDIYGEQSVVAQGHLPAAVIAGSPFFARRMLGRGPPMGHYIHVYAADLARGPGGQWRVLNDRVRLATGIGYALENRLAMSRTTGTLLGELNVRRVADFFARLREGMGADSRRDRPRIALLTPGRFNQTYPEQAHLARYLGLPLVEGRDLSVQDDKLFVRTIAGPKRIDAIWRWVNTNALDPLAFDARSQIGVANLFEAWSAGQLELVNCPGVEVLESPAFSAFLPRLCGVLLDEEPILPTVATWWCGQPGEARTVQARLDELAVLPAFGQPVEGLGGGPTAGAALDGKQRAALLEALDRRPMDYCAQEIVHLSTTPAVIEGAVVPRPFTLRAFVARTADGSWTVMPGGFARIGATETLPNGLMGSGDYSADCWIVEDAPPVSDTPSAFAHEPPISRGAGILASQAADNLYWFGRYNERAEITVRIVRAILGGSIEVDGGRTGGAEARGALAGLLHKWGAVESFAPDGATAGVCAAALSDSGLPGSVPALIARCRDIGLGLRERFTGDLWRIVSQPMPALDPQGAQGMLSAVNRLVVRFSALAGLASDNMVRGAAWRFMEIGKRVERALATCRIAGELAGGEPDADRLGTLLDLCDSQIVYRSRYLAGPMRNPVLDLVLLDPDNPRSLAFQVNTVAEHLSQLPPDREDDMPDPPLRRARAMVGRLGAACAREIDATMLAEVEAGLLALSDAISLRYFLQLETPDAGTVGNLLG